jgi:hypothetical protein
MVSDAEYEEAKRGHLEEKGEIRTFQEYPLDDVATAPRASGQAVQSVMRHCIAYSHYVSRFYLTIGKTAVLCEAFYRKAK